MLSHKLKCYIKIHGGSFHHRHAAAAVIMKVLDVPSVLVIVSGVFVPIPLAEPFPKITPLAFKLTPPDETASGEPLMVTVFAGDVDVAPKEITKPPDVVFNVPFRVVAVVPIA